MSNKNFLSYYKNELNILRDLGREYAYKQPLLASYLSETSKDPDSERLIEAVAFLNANLKKEIDNNSNILIQELIDIIYPEYFKPTPSISILEFIPTDELSERLFIKKNTYINSKKKNKIKCKFRTAWDLNLYPLKVKNIFYSENTNSNNSSLNLELFSTKPINELDLDELDFYIDMSLSNSLALAKMLMNDLHNIELSFGNETFYIKDEYFLNLASKDYTLFAYDTKTLKSFKIISEYFTYIRKCLFFRFTNLKKYSDEIYSNSFSIKFNFKIFKNDFLNIRENNIKLFCVPIINVFEYDLEPIRVNYINELMKIVTSHYQEEFYLLYDLKEVRGLKNIDQKKKVYEPFNNFEEGKYSYKLFRKKAFGDTKKDLNYLQVFYKDNKFIDDVITMNAEVTNGTLCETLQIGEISLNSENSPEYCVFNNIVIPSFFVESPIENKNLSYLLSTITTNILGVKDIIILKDILKFFISNYSRDKENNRINIKKIDSLSKYEVENINKLQRGVFISGRKVTIISDSSYFVNIEDMYLFGQMLYRFFKSTVLINNYLELFLVDKYSGERYDYK